jgi:hypothetical protein
MGLSPGIFSIHSIIPTIAKQAPFQPPFPPPGSQKVPYLRNYLLIRLQSVHFSPGLPENGKNHARKNAYLGSFGGPISPHIAEPCMPQIPPKLRCKKAPIDAFWWPKGGCHMVQDVGRAAGS